MTTWALIPIKAFDRGKSRLADVLSPNERQHLTQELFAHVVGVLRNSPSIDQIAIVSDSADARAHARQLGLLPLSDPPGEPGLARVVDEALGELERRGATNVIVCMSDLPDLTPEDIESVTRALSESDVVLVPDRMSAGTNLIALRPPTVLPSCLGHEDSLQRHVARARSLGLTLNVQLRRGIAFDVDRPTDLDRLRER
jgi:2-phospho-L-lactate guanylyltransferase